MKIFAVMKGEFNPRIEALHIREWAADWHAWKLAPQPAEYKASPTYGHPGWGFAEDPVDADAYVIVVPWTVTVP